MLRTCPTFQLYRHSWTTLSPATKLSSTSNLEWGSLEDRLPGVADRSFAYEASSVGGWSSSDRVEAFMMRLLGQDAGARSSDA